ncbi:MAG: TlpA family protein disulfide reductase [Pseudomonas sp.]
MNIKIGFAVLISLLSTCHVAFALEKGEQIPAFELETNKDTKITSESLRGSYTYIDFWASWCGPCRQSFPWMNALQEKYKDKNLRILAINLDVNQADANKFLAEVPAHFEIAFDSKGITPKLYAVKGMPSSLLISPDGKVIFQHTGFNTNKADELDKLISQQLGASR